MLSSVRAVRGDDVPDIDQAVPRAAVDRRADRGVLQIQARGLDRGLVLLDLRLAHVHGVLPRVVILPRDGLGLDQVLHARKLNPGEVQRRLGLREVRLGGIELRLERPRVDREQRIALLQVRAVGEMDLRDPAGDLRLHGNHLARDAPSRLRPDRRARLGDRGDDDTGDGGRSIAGGSFFAQPASSKAELHIKTSNLSRRDINLLSLRGG